MKYKDVLDFKFSAITSQSLTPRNNASTTQGFKSALLS